MAKFRTLDLAIKFYQSAEHEKFPKRHIQDQFDRALLSVVLNLSEGNAKPTQKDRRKFIYISYASLRELQTLLTLTNKLKLLHDSDSLAAHLYRLCKSLD